MKALQNFSRHSLERFKNVIIKETVEKFIISAVCITLPKRYAHPDFQQCPGNFTFSLFLAECSMKGSIFRKKAHVFREEKHS